MENTRDIFDFPARERKIAGKLLLALNTDRDRTMRLRPQVTVEFNPASGYVFLIDTSFNVAMLKGEYLEDWIYCPKCKREGFLSDLGSSKPCCKDQAAK